MARNRVSTQITERSCNAPGGHCCPGTAAVERTEAEAIERKRVAEVGDEEEEAEEEDENEDEEEEEDVMKDGQVELDSSTVAGISKCHSIYPEISKPQVLDMKSWPWAPTSTI